MKLARLETLSPGKEAKSAQLSWNGLNWMGLYAFVMRLRIHSFNSLKLRVWWDSDSNAWGKLTPDVTANILLQTWVWGLELQKYIENENDH